MRLHDAELRRQRRTKADLIEAVSSGYGGCQSEANGRATGRLIELLRRSE